MRAKPNSPRELGFNFIFKPKIKSTDAECLLCTKAVLERGHRRLKRKSLGNVILEVS